MPGLAVMQDPDAGCGSRAEARRSASTSRDGTTMRPVYGKAAERQDNRATSREIKLRGSGEIPMPCRAKPRDSACAGQSSTASTGRSCILQEDGRMTNIELARRVGISPPPCLRRVRALEEAGLHPRLPRRPGGRGAGLRGHRVRPDRPAEPGGSRPEGIRGAGRQPGPRCAKRTCSPARPIFC